MRVISIDVCHCQSQSNFSSLKDTGIQLVIFYIYSFDIILPLWVSSSLYNWLCNVFISSSCVKEKSNPLMFLNVFCFNRLLRHCLRLRPHKGVFPKVILRGATLILHWTPVSISSPLKPLLPVFKMK